MAYHNVKVPAGVSLQPYALYIIVQQGQLKVVHVYGKHSTALTVGRGLNRDEWHSVTVGILIQVCMSEGFLPFRLYFRSMFGYKQTSY